MVAQVIKYGRKSRYCGQQPPLTIELDVKVDVANRKNLMQHTRFDHAESAR